MQGNTSRLPGVADNDEHDADEIKREPHDYERRTDHAHHCRVRRPPFRNSYTPSDEEVFSVTTGRQRHLLPCTDLLSGSGVRPRERQLQRIEEGRIAVGHAMTKDARLALQAEKSGLPLPRGSASDLFDLLHADVHFLLVATRHILVLARGIRDMAKREADMKVRDGLIAAHNRFASRHLDAKAMRDLLEHFDAYAEGGGNLRSQLDEHALDWGPLAGTLADQREEDCCCFMVGCRSTFRKSASPPSVWPRRCMRLSRLKTPLGRCGPQAVGDE